MSSFLVGHSRPDGPAVQIPSQSSTSSNVMAEKTGAEAVTGAAALVVARAESDLVLQQLLSVN